MRLPVHLIQGQLDKKTFFYLEDFSDSSHSRGMLEGIVLICPKVFEDERGFFLEEFHEKRYKTLGVEASFCQDNHSFSKQGVIRGMHAQKGQSKLVSCPVGEIFDVVVDLRSGSPTFGKWEGFYLSETNHHQLFIPEGFVHGFCVVSSSAHVFYKVSSFYDPELERGFRYNDPRVQIEWPIQNPILSKRDQENLSFLEVVV